MAINAKGHQVQAFAIHDNTFIGTATNENKRDGTIHAAADGDITFHFKNGDVKLTGVKAGMDFQAAPNCTGITSTATVIIS
jgi:hypothetical protein